MKLLHLGFIKYYLFFNQNNLADKEGLKNYQSISIKMAPAGKSVASIDLEKIKKSNFLIITIYFLQIKKAFI